MIDCKGLSILTAFADGFKVVTSAGLVTLRIPSPDARQGFDVRLVKDGAIINGKACTPGTYVMTEDGSIEREFTESDRKRLLTSWTDE